MAEITRAELEAAGYTISLDKRGVIWIWSLITDTQFVSGTAYCEEDAERYAAYHYWLKQADADNAALRARLADAEALLREAHEAATRLADMVALWENVPYLERAKKMRTG